MLPHSRRAGARRTALFLMALGAVPAAAQVSRVEEVQVTATRIAATAQEFSEGLTVVSGDDLAAAQSQIVSDALRGRAGVYVQQTTAGQGTAIVRGLKGSEVLHLVDGMRLNNALFRNAPNQYLALVDPFIAERIEVVRGPVSTLYGSDAMGGVLQVVTERPFLGGGDWQTRSRVLGRFDSRTLGRSAHASIAAGGGALSLGAALSYQDHDDLRAAGRRAQTPTAYRSRAASAHATMRPDEDRSFALSVQYLEQPSTPRYDELVAGFGQSEPASDEFRFEPNSRLFVHAEQSLSGRGGWLDDFEAHLALQTMHDDRRTRDFGATTERREQNESRLWGLTLRGAAERGPVHSLTYGLDVYHDTVSSSRLAVDVVDGSSQPVRPRFPDGSTLRTMDAYVSDAMALTERIHLSAGARLSSARVELTGDAERPAAEIDNTDLTGSLGLRYALTDGVSLLANLGRGFRAPNIFDLGTLGARPGNRFNIANPELGPETVWTLDAGVRASRARYDLEAFVWISDYRDKITSVATGGVDAAGRDIVQSRNADSVTLRGAELAARFVATARLSAEFGLNVVWGEVESPGGGIEPADRIPPLNGRLGLRYERSRWWLAGSLRYAADQDRLSARDVRDPRIDPAGTAGWGIVDLDGGLRLRGTVDLAAGIKNLTDKAYREHGSGLDAPGRAVVVTIEGRF